MLFRHDSDLYREKDRDDKAYYLFPVKVDFTGPS